MLGRGRYRLLQLLGRDERSTAQLWRGRDSVLERDVALTVFVADPADGAAVARTASAVQRALRSARLDTAGAARVLDVLEPEPGPGPTIAAVVAEWTPGRDLVDLVSDGLPPPSVAATTLAPLAGAVDAAHRAGLVLGCDHPQRIRVTPDGQARLAFPGAPADAGSRDDVRGLGAALYLLLTGKWPLPGGPAGLPAAPLGPDGSPLPPRSVRPSVPQELSTLAVRSLAGSGTAGVHTGAAVQRVLELHAVDPAETDLLPVTPDGGRTGSRRVAGPGRSLDARRKLRLGVAALVLAVALIGFFVVSQVASLFDGGGDAPPALVVGSSGTAPPPPGAPPPAAPVQVTGLAVYDPSGRGTPDNTEDVQLAADGNPGTAWATDEYLQPFPAYKPGIGVMLTLPAAVAVSSVTVESPSAGTVLEVRAAPSPTAPLEATTVLATQTLGSGVTAIPLQQAPPTQFLLVWITGLAGGGTENRSELSEVVVQAS